MSQIGTVFARQLASEPLNLQQQVRTAGGSTIKQQKFIIANKIPQLVICRMHLQRLLYILYYGLIHA